MHARTARLVVVLTAAVFLAVGCDTTKAPGTAVADPLSAAAYPQVAALYDLNKKIAADRPVVTTQESGALSVEAPIRVLSNRDLSAQYRFIFFDQRGRVVQPEQEWQYILLPARAQRSLRGTSFAPATDWRLEIRPAR